MPESVAWTLMVGLFLALIGSLGYRNHKRRERFTMAADTFRSAFDTAVVRLEKEPGCHRNILESEFDRHEQAAIIFMNYLGRDRDRFRKALEKYKAYAIQQTTDVPIFALIGTEVDDLNMGKYPAHVKEVAGKRKNECLSYINELLDYAKPKD